jgi:hypothetical protein
VTDSESAGAQDQLDYSKWQVFFREHVAFVSNKVLMKMRDDIDQERDDRVDAIIGEMK